MKHKQETITILGFEFHSVSKQAWKSAPLFAGRTATVRRSARIGGYTAAMSKPKSGGYKSKGSGKTPEEALTKLLAACAEYHERKMLEHRDLMNQAQEVLSTQPSEKAAQ